MIVQCCTSALKSGHNMVFPGLVVNCEIPVYTVSLHWDRFTTEGKEAKGTGAPKKAVRCGVESVLRFFPFIPSIQRSLFGNPLCFIVPGNCFEVSFQSNISLSGPCSFISKSRSENFPFVWDLVTKCESFL